MKVGENMASNVKEKTPYVSETTSMKIDLVGDSFIDANIKLLGILPVTNPQRFQRGNIPTEDGLFSPEIFGTTSEEQMRQFGYINLNCKVFHPYAYEIIKRMWAKIDTIAMGQSSWVVAENGEVLEDPEGDPENTGIDWLVKNFRKIKFNPTGSRIRDERVKLLDSLKDDELFITKWLVIPVGYRAIQMINGVQNVPAINKNYSNIIRYANSLPKDAMFTSNNMAKYNIQQQLIAIRQFGQSLVEKKRGFFKRNVLGKTTDYGYRSVISVFVIDEADKPEDNPIDMFHTGVPLAQLCVLFYPFIKRYVLNFFHQTMEEMGNRVPVQDDPKDPSKIRYVKITDPEYYSDSEIQKIIDQFVNTPRIRFRPVTLPTEEGNKPIYFTGQGKNRKPTSFRASGIGTRVLTWTDLLYMAAVDVCADKHVYITRYPLEDYFGTFPSRIHVLSTMKTTPMIVNDQLYKYYPDIDPTLPEAKVGTLFNDTVNMDNTYLKGLGGDFELMSLPCHIHRSHYSGNRVYAKISERLTSGVSNLLQIAC